MISKVRIKYLRSLQQKKYRQEYKRFVIESPKVIHELISQRHPALRSIIGLEEVLDEIPTTEIPTDVASERDLKAISSLKTPSTLLAECDFLASSLSQHSDVKRVIYLDDLQNPGNVGAILRTASWHGIDLVILSPHTADPYNPKVVQASMGAIFHQPWCQADVEELTSLDLPIYAAHMDGDHYRQLDLSEACVIIGNEGQGINKSLLSRSDARISIPRSVHSQAESLNASIAAAIIMAEMSHQVK